MVHWLDFKTSKANINSKVVSAFSTKIIQSKDYLVFRKVYSLWERKKYYFWLITNRFSFKSL